MRRAAVLAVAVAAVCCLAGVASGLVLGPPADRTTANATADETTGTPPGATVSGAVVTEESALDGQLRVRSYERRLARADTTAERLAVLQSIRTDLSARLTALERRQEALADRSFFPGKRVYLRTAVAADATTLSRIADSGDTLARQYGNATLADRFQRLAAAYTRLGQASGSDLLVGFELAGGDAPLAAALDDSNLTAVAAGDVVTVADRPLGTVSDRTVEAVLRSPLVEPDRTTYESLSEPERENATLSEVLVVNESALSSLSSADVAPLRRTDAISLDESSLRAFAAAEGFDLDESVFRNRTGNESLDGTDDALNETTDGTDDVLNGSDDPDTTDDALNETTDGTDSADDGNLTDGTDTTVDDLFDDSEGTDDTLNDSDDTLNDSDGTLDDSDETTDADGTPDTELSVTEQRSVGPVVRTDGTDDSAVTVSRPAVRAGSA